MVSDMNSGKLSVDSLPPVLFFLVRKSDVSSSQGEYRADLSWGEFDSLKVRAIQDLYFDPSVSKKAIYAFTAEPPHGERVAVVSLPTQLALEQVFSHLSEPFGLVLNTRDNCPHAAIPQSGLDFSVPEDFEASVELKREELPALIGGMIAQSKGDRLAACQVALKRGSYFECYYLANRERLVNPTDKSAWFYELFAYSFFGLANEALNLYENYPGQGGSDPLSQLLAARYRLLLKQLNEARTILHTLSFNADWGALASCELARSYMIDKQFSRALDAANAALKHDADFREAYILRGAATRGIAYEGGDVESLKDSYGDFERVAKLGGYGAAEAIYHAGTILARLGALSDAENAFRQSLFQRDRITARDALIRILCAQGAGATANSELMALERLVPNYGAKLRAEVGASLTAKDNSHNGGASESRSASTSTGSTTQVRECSELWSDDLDSAVKAAIELLKVWDVPLSASIADFAFLDDLINRFAPDGDFPQSGRFSALSKVGPDVTARALALHLGDLLARGGGGELAFGEAGSNDLVLLRNGVTIPLEGFVRDRVLLGASGDNFSSLESLALELILPDSNKLDNHVNSWWQEASDARQAQFAAEVAWVCDKLKRFGVELDGTLGDLEALDRWIDSAFEPGGTLKNSRIAEEDLQLDRLVTGIGLVIGDRAKKAVAANWYDHEKPEGISLWNGVLGRMFPVAKAQRRVYLASAADFSAKFGGLAWSVAVAAATEGVRSGQLAGHEAVKSALIQLLPSMGEFPETELSGVVDSLLIGASLRS
jgi:tetratricopeptide (TPR) repeat protein